jgi:hypothetical protein
MKPCVATDGFINVALETSWSRRYYGKQQVSQFTNIDLVKDRDIFNGC